MLALIELKRAKRKAPSWWGVLSLIAVCWGSGKGQLIIIIIEGIMVLSAV